LFGGAETMKTRLTRFMTSPYVYVFVAVLLLDVLTKQWAASIRINLTVIDGFFYLRYSRNTGAAWSILSNNQGLLAVISFVVGVGFAYYYVRQYTTYGWINHLASVLFLSGTWGNFIDRAFFPEGVIDFLSFHFGDYIFPTFNVADSALTVGVILFMGASFFEKKHENA
jgi:signal peptidase II